MVVDRYAQIQSAEDLGGIEMFPDRTPDLRMQEALDDGAPTPEVAEGSNRPTNR